MSQIDFQEEPPQIDFQEEPSSSQLLARTSSPKYRSSFSDILLDAGAGIIHKIAHPFETTHDAVQGVTDLAQAASRKAGLMPEGTPNIPVAPVLSPEQVQYGVQQLWPSSQPGPYQQGVQRFLGGLGSAMTSPEIAVPGAGAYAASKMGLAAIPQAIGKAFQVTMPMQVPDAVKATVQGIKSNDVPAAVEGGLNALLSVAPAVHPVYEGFRPILDKVTEAQRPLETSINDVANEAQAARETAVQASLQQQFPAVSQEIPGVEIQQTAPQDPIAKENAARKIALVLASTGDNGGEVGLTIDSYVKDGTLTPKEGQQIEQRIKTGQFRSELSPEEFFYQSHPEVGSTIKANESPSPKPELSDKQFTDLKHDLKALQQGHLYALELGTGPTTAEFEKARGTIWMKAVQTGDYNAAQAELSALKKSLRKPAGQGATEGLSAPVEDGQRQIQPAPPSGGMTPEEQAMEQKRLADLQIEEEPKLAGPRLVTQEFRGKEMDADQILNRMRNKLHPGEWEAYKEKGIEEAFRGKKVDPGEVSKWMEENGPKVEVKKLEAGGAASEKQQRMAYLQHTYIDILPQQVINELNNYVKEFKNDPESADTSSWRSQVLDNLPNVGSRLAEWVSVIDEYVKHKAEGVEAATGRNESATARYTMVNPKPLDKMPGAVDLLVRIPFKGEKGLLAGEYGGPGEPKYSSSHYPTEGKNLLAHARAYVETLPAIMREKFGMTKVDKPLKVVHGFEFQSDYAQEFGLDSHDKTTAKWLDSVSHQPRSQRFSTIEEAKAKWKEEFARYNKAHPEMMLPWNAELGVKALIEHAKKEGADAIAISDAETAMMTEGHDRLSLRMQESRASGGAYNPEPEQAAGMRLHYDRTLPKIAEELTGQKGKKVDFGEHQNVREGDTRTNYHRQQGEPGPKIRSDLIFRNADSTPKTSITARLYSLDKTRPEDFTLFGKDKPKPGIESEPSNSTTFARANSVESRDLERLAIKEGTTAHSALEALAAKPELFGPENAKLAKFLTDNFEHVLRTVELKPDAGRSENNRANYDPIPHSIQLALGNDGNSIPFKLLEESAHAATWWQFEKARTPTQLKAKENITRLLEQATLNAPEDVQSQIGTAERGLAYRLKSEQEFIAGLFTDPELKQLLKGFKVKGGELVELSGWDAAKNYIRELLGIAPDTAYAKALEQLVEVGAERDMTSIDRARADYELDPVSAPSHVPVLATIHDITFGNKADKFLDKMRGYTYPAHAAVSHNLANHLARYAASAVYGPEGAKSIATDVLGPRYWRTDHKLLGAAIVEDQLRQARKVFQAQADAESDPAKKAVLQDKADSVITTVGNSRIGPPTRAQAESGIKSEQHYQRIWNNTENQEIVQRFKDKVMPIAEQQHVALGGKVLAPSEETGVFANLRALLGDDSVESRNSMIFGSRRGNLSNPLITGSRFAMERKGTAQSYDFSMRNMIDRMIRGNYEKAALDAYYKVVEDEGFGTLQKQGKDVVTETIKGQPLRLLEIKRRGGGPGQTVIDRLWIRKDLYDEARKATDTDHVPERGVLGFIADVAATIQVTGTVDIASHLVSMVSTISGMPGTQFGPLFDAIKKKVPPVGFADALIRIGYNWTKAIHDQPETQRAIAEYSKEGAGRPLPQHQGDLVGRILKALGTPEKIAEAVDLPAHLAKASSKVLRGMDQGGRLAALAMYKEMVQRGMVEDSPLAMRETVNNLGQYQSRMMGHFPELFRRIGMSNFVVAGTTMNRNAVRRLLTSPLMRAASPEAWAKMRLVEGISLAGAVLALPFVLNYYFTGNINGRKGTPIGAIDYGKKENEDGSHDYFDPLQLLLLRRALRITGLQSLYRGIEEKSGAKKTAQNMVKDMVQAYLHPFLGPAPRLAYTAATGKDTSGYLLSRNPESMSENVTAAMKNMNPNVAAWIKGKEKGQGKGESTLRALGVSVGLKTSPVPSYQDRLDAEAKKQFPGKEFGQLGVRERRSVVKAAEATAPGNDNELAKRAAGMRAYWADYEKQDALKAALPKEQQEWLDNNKLTLPAFKAEFTVGRTKIKGTSEEEKAMAEEVQRQYQDRLDKLMENPTFENLAQKEKQRRLGNVLDLARNKARIKLRRRMNEAGLEAQTPP